MFREKWTPAVFFTLLALGTGVGHLCFSQVAYAAGSEGVHPTAAGEKETETPLPIRLSGGVGLAQTLPEGTAVGFSVDYEWTAPQEQKSKSDKFFWEIKLGKGKVVAKPVDIKQGKGTLQDFFPVKPEDGPFEARVSLVTGKSKKPVPLSKWLPIEGVNNP